MGCSNSKVENEEGVARCKARKRLMKQAVVARHTFAASHAQYVISLKGVGSAFRQFADGEVKEVEVHHLYAPDTPTTPPPPPSLALVPPPPPMLPSPPGLSPALSPMLPPSPPPPSPPRLELLRTGPKKGSPLARAVSSPDTFGMEQSPRPPPPITIKAYRMEHTPPIIPSRIHRFEDSPSPYMPRAYRLQDSPPPPPLVTPIQMDDDWRYTPQAPPPPAPLREGNPPPPPPIARSSWQDLFLDPFRPAPPSFNYMEQRRNQEMEQRRSQEMEQRRSQEMEQRRVHEMEQRRLQELEQRRNHEMEQRKKHDMEQRKLHEMEQRRIHEMEQQRRNHEIQEQRRLQEMEHQRRMQERPMTPPERPKPREKSPERAPVKVEETKPAPEAKPAPEPENKKLKQLEDDDIPDLEDVDEEIDDDIDGPRPKDSDDEKDNNVVMVVEPETPPKAEPEPPKEIKAAPPPKPPKAEQRDELAKTNKELAVVIPEKGGRDLLDVLKEVDDCFLRASESGEIVSRMLETRKAHYHSSFSESLRGVGESARMLNTSFWKLSSKSGSISSHFRTSSNLSTLSDETASITSLRSYSSLSSARWTEECGMNNSHASTLDRLFAWEKKLYIEVKEAEALRIELERKYALYRHQDAKGEDQTVVDKTRSTIKALQTRMVVAIQAVDSAATAVQKLRDDELYPQLLDLLEGLGNMWRDMSACHQAQLKAVEAMKRLDNSAACEPTTSYHRQSTVQLENALMKWAEGLSRVVHSQRDYLKNLTSWLRLSLMQFSNEEMDRNGARSPSRSPRSPIHSVGASPIFGLCQQWQASLDQLPDRVVLEAISAFAAVVREMLRLQWEELRIKKRVETYQRDLEKREHSLMNASMREPPSSSGAPVPRSPTTTSGSDNEERYDMAVREGFPERSEVAERRLRMEVARRRLEDELEAERKAYTDTRAYTLSSLQMGLPQLFQAVLTFSNSEAEIYDKLNSMAGVRKQASIMNK